MQTQGAGGYGNGTAGGGGGAVRHSMMHHTATSNIPTMMEATTRWARSVIDESVNLLRKVEVHVRQSTLAVRAQHDTHFVVADVDIRVVLGILGEFRDSIHEIDRLLEILEFERALDVLSFHFPRGKVLDRFLDLFVIEKTGHDCGIARHHPMAILFPA
jgi:hypothetical protein